MNDEYLFWKTSPPPLSAQGIEVAPDGTMTPVIYKEGVRHAIIIVESTAKILSDEEQHASIPEQS